MSTSPSPFLPAAGRLPTVVALLLSMFMMNVPSSFASTAQTKTVANSSVKKVAAKNAKRSNTSTVVNTLLNGIGAPSASLGVNGDFYIDTVALNIYGPKTKSAWPIPKSLIGPQGVAGAAGKQGVNGKDGRDGTNGKDGRDGINGKDGERGASGASGSGSGSAGPAGPAGPTGPAGPAGPAGASGAQGAPGVAGAAGASGAAGAQGIQGEVGPRGLQGIQGETGAAGSNGSAGATGAAGAQGIQGEVGPRGLQGIQGETGAAGSNGSAGATGAAGATGPARVIHGNTSNLSLNVSTAGTGIASQPVVTYQANKKYFFTITQYGAIDTIYKNKYLGMEVFATNSSDLKYAVKIMEAYSYRSSTLIHEYIFEATGTFSTSTNPGDLSFSITAGSGMSGYVMSLSGTYQLIETNAISRIDQTNPVTAIS